MRLSKWARALAAAIALVAVSPQLADAASHPDSSGAYSGQIGGPTIYQTNYAYQTADMVPPAGTHAGTTTTVNYSWYFNTYTAGLPYYVGLCDNVRCVWLGYAYGSGSSGSTTAFSGDNSTSDFSFAFEVVDSTTHTITPSAGGVDRLTVNYNY